MKHLQIQTYKQWLWCDEAELLVTTLKLTHLYVNFSLIKESNVNDYTVLLNTHEMRLATQTLMFLNNNIKK